MGSCTRRHFLLSTCFLQMITIIERQVFDFLGYMWAPIFVNFFHIIFVIFGIYGAYHFRIKYILAYLVWSIIWIGWNAFLICFYLNVGVLDRDSDLLNLGTGSVSWFEVNAYGCKPIYPTNITSDDPYRPIRPERVDDCLLDYEVVEVLHSGVQCALALLGVIGAILIGYLFLDEDDRFDFMNGDAKSPQHLVVHPMYVSYTSIPTSASATLLSNKHHHNQQQQQLHAHLNHQQHPNNNNTFLINTNSSNSNSNSNNHSHKKKRSNSSQALNASKNNLNANANDQLFSPKSSNLNNYKMTASTTSILSASTTATPIAKHHHQQHYNKQQQQHLHSKLQQQQQQQQYYDDSTAKADQLYTNSNRRQQMLPTLGTPTATYQQHVATPTSSHDNTTSSLSYASLQNSNFNLPGGFVGMATPLSNSNYSLSNSINNNNTNNVVTPMGTQNSGRFARIHPKPKPPKSTSYSSFINSGISTTGSGSLPPAPQRPDIRYTQMSSGERASQSFEEGFEDDNFSLQNFKADDGVTYVPFQKPTPGAYNNNPSFTTLNSFAVNQSSLNNNATPGNNNIINNNNHSLSGVPVHYPRDNSQVSLAMNGNDILLENGAMLQHAVGLPTATPPPAPLSVKHINKLSKHRQSLYSIEFGPSLGTIRSRADTILDYDAHLQERDGSELSPKPMTPRRVKRRSVMARGSNNRTSTTSRRSTAARGDNSSSGGSGTHPRSSTRSSRRKYQQNPVTKLLDQQQQQLQQQQQQHHHHHHTSSHHHGSSHHHPHSSGSGSGTTNKQHFGSFQRNKDNAAATLTITNLQTLNQELISKTSGAAGSTANILAVAGAVSKNNNNHYHSSFHKNIPPDPIYYNINGQAGLFQPAWQASSQSPIEAPASPVSPTLVGHYNPTYQHSTTNLNDGEHVDELYNNRPPSVRSSYSNFHGTRPVSAYLPGTTIKENVFAGLTGAQQPMLPQPQHVPPSTPPLYQQHPLHRHSPSEQQLPLPSPPSYPTSQPQNIPVTKRSASRESIRSMAFMTNGPPAYNLNYHTPPDSETTM